MATSHRLIGVLVSAVLGCASGWAQGNPPYPGTQPTKAADRTTVAPGGTILWTVTIYNDASDAQATCFLSDDVPDPADGYPVQAFDPATDVVSVPPGTTRTYNGDQLSLQNLIIPGRQSREVVLRTRVLASAASGTQICNRAYTRHVITECRGNPFPICDDYSYDSATRPPGASTPGPVCVTVQVPPPVLIEPQTLATVRTDSCPSDPAFPAPDGVFSPGEQLTLTLAIQNNGGTDANAQPNPIRGTLSPGAGYTVLSGASSYTTTVQNNRLRANGANHGTNDTPFVIRIDPGVACPGSITVPLVVSQIQGGPYTVNFTFPIGGCIPRCLNAPLSAGPAAVRDVCGQSPPGGNGRVDPGEDVFLFLPVRNGGSDALGGNPTIRGTLASLTPGVAVIPGSDLSDYPDAAAGATVANLAEYGIRVSDTLACGTPINLRLTLADTTAGVRTLDYALAVAAPCTVCSAACVATAEVVPAGPTRYCEGDTVTLDASGSALTNCNGVIEYQWYEGAGAIAGATAASYDVPRPTAPGDHPFAVEVSCSTQSLCNARSPEVVVTVDERPRLTRLLKGIKDGDDADFTWEVEPSAVGGYRLYRTEFKTLVRTARDGTVDVDLAAQTAADPNDNAATDPGAVVAAPRLYHYQVLALCSDNQTEGPN